jgi:hypothetical protein
MRVALCTGLATTVALAAFTVAAVPAQAQGKNKKATPPSASPLPSVATGPAASASLLSWLDDATLLAPGSTSVTLSMLRWSGSDLSEVDFPVIEASIGLTPRFQVGASVPHIVGSADGTGPVGGVGTSYISSKIALLNGSSEVKLAFSPVIEVLGTGAAQALAPGEGRLQLGLPVSLEVGQGAARVFASTGFFTRGAWFAGGGVGVQATPKLGVSLSFTRSWIGDSSTTVARDRREVSGGASYFISPQVAVYGTLGRTVATTDANGAGTTVSGGVSFLFKTRITT